MADSTICPKCSGVMVRGFVADFSFHQVAVSTWVEGPPRASFWKGTEFPAEKSLPIGAFRCSECGFLEYYARPEFAAK